MHQHILPHDHGQHQQTAYLQKELQRLDRFAAAAELFRQLADPTRLRIFWLLCHREECVINISAFLGMSSPAVSHHLRALTASGLLTSRRNGKEVYYTLADNQVCDLLHPALEQVLEIACPPQEQSPQQLALQVHSYLTQDLRRRITQEELAKIFHINTTTLQQVFKAQYGDSIAAHMLRHRMEAAAQLLQQGQGSVAQIARAVGFQSQSRFSEAFRRVYGVLPTEYR